MPQEIKILSFWSVVFILVISIIYHLFVWNDWSWFSVGIGIIFLCIGAHHNTISHNTNPDAILGTVGSTIIATTFFIKGGDITVLLIGILFAIFPVIFFTTAIELVICMIRNWWSHRKMVSKAHY